MVAGLERSPWSSEPSWVMCGNSMRWCHWHKTRFGWRPISFHLRNTSLTLESFTLGWLKRHIIIIIFQIDEYEYLYLISPVFLRRLTGQAWVSHDEWLTNWGWPQYTASAACAHETAWNTNADCHITYIVEARRNNTRPWRLQLKIKLIILINQHNAYDR